MQVQDSRQLCTTGTGHKLTLLSFACRCCSLITKLCTCCTHCNLHHCLPCQWNICPVCLCMTMLYAMTESWTWCTVSNVHDCLACLSQVTSQQPAPFAECIPYSLSCSGQGIRDYLACERRAVSSADCLCIMMLWSQQSCAHLWHGEVHMVFQIVYPCPVLDPCSS